MVQNWRFRSNNGGPLTQNVMYKGLLPTNHSFSQKTRLNDLSYGIKIWTDFSCVQRGKNGLSLKVPLTNQPCHWLAVLATHPRLCDDW